MKNKLFLNFIFYGLIITIAFLGGLLYHKAALVTPLLANSPLEILAATSPAPIANLTKTNTPSANPPPVKPIIVPTAPTCIIIVDGQKYNVQSLRNSHSGGDVFQCGTDMSAVFHGQHGGNLRMIQKYIIN